MISIIMSCYKSNFEYLKQQIDSIINQTEKDWELLIHPDNEEGEVENGRLMAFVSGYRDKRIKFDLCGHLGYARAYNQLHKQATGEYVCFFHKDSYNILFYYFHNLE